MSYTAAEDRYTNAPFRTAGRSGLKLPPISLGLWHNFGADTPLERQRAILRTAFDLGVTHFDLANNYGTPYGSAETNFGRLFREDFRPYRDELIVSTQAGWDMWPGPYGQGGGSRKYCLRASTRACNAWGSNTWTFSTRIASIPTRRWRRQPARSRPLFNRARRCMSESLPTRPRRRERWRRLLRAWKVPLLIHQPAYSMLNRKIEGGLFEAVEQVGAGMIAFSPLAAGRAVEQLSRRHSRRLARDA